MRIGAAALEDLGRSLDSCESVAVITSGGVIAALVGILLGAAERTFLLLTV